MFGYFLSYAIRFVALYGLSNFYPASKRADALRFHALNTPTENTLPKMFDHKCPLVINR